MIDTVILQLGPGKFSVINYAFFKTTEEWVLNCLGFKKWPNNPSSTDTDYKPRLTLIKRGFGLFLKVEFSAPKMIHKNNLEELEESDFGRLIECLQMKLRKMGVISSVENLAGAEVLAFHPSKNIPLSKWYTATMAIGELKKVDVSRKFDFDIKNYRNGGETLQIYSRIHGLVIYDKMRDMGKSVRRAIDKDQGAWQKGSLSQIRESNPGLEVLRMEARLNKRRKINEVLKELGFSPSPTFRDIFKKEVCQRIMGHYWNMFFDDNLFLFNTNNNPQSILRLIIAKYPGIRPTKAYKLIGLYMLARDKEGIIGLRRALEGRRPGINWSKAKQALKAFEDDIFTGSVWGFLDDIKRELRDFKPFRLGKRF